MEQRTNYLSLILLDALEDENERDINFILDRNSKAIDPSYVPQDRGIAPLHYVCGMENQQLAINVTKRFLKMGANPNCRTEDNMTPLHVACIYGRDEIVSLLLQHGADLEVYDNEFKTPLLYAIEECYFEIVKIVRDHIFLMKYEMMRQQNALFSSESKFRNKLQHLYNSLPISSSTLQKPQNDKIEAQGPLNKGIFKVKNTLDDSSGSDTNKFTPNRVHYNYDVTSPYYINITHRRNKPQPKFPPLQPENNDNERLENTLSKEVKSVEDVLSISKQNTIQSPSAPEEVINIFSLTEDNLNELAERTAPRENSPKSLIENWREKVRVSRARKSICKEFDNIIEMIDEVMEHDYLNFTNTKLKEKEKSPKNIESDSDIQSTSNVFQNSTEYLNLPDENNKSEINEKQTPQKRENFLSKLMQVVTEAKVQDFEPDCLETPQNTSAKQDAEAESSYQTVPEITVSSPKETKGQAADTISYVMRSPKTKEYYLQMTEAYVHTDDDNGLVFYETKLLSNCAPKTPCPDFEKTMTSQSTNLTLPLDYETDALRAELTAFGEAPGPITKSTKKLYIKRLVKYKRKTELMKELAKKNKNNLFKFSVELHRTLKSEDFFGRIKDYMQYEKQSSEYFESSENKKQMREGHLKQSFVYMLLDPRISCNLPSESVFLKEFDVWQRFLQSIFYVGKGKTSRPYSHLYDAMKYHSRLHNRELQAKKIKQGQLLALKKMPINVDIFKSPPQKSTNSKKLDRILNIWSTGNGVVSLHVFHNIMPIDAYTREAAIIDALSLQHLTNCKRGDYYGPAKTWTMREKKYLGIALLFKAMRIYLAEGESQLSPSDLI